MAFSRFHQGQDLLSFTFGRAVRSASGYSPSWAQSSRDSDMPTLSRDHRKDLERTIRQARRAAEIGARNAIKQLGVGDGDAPRYLTPDQQALRRRLRAHGRQLGDRRDEKRGGQAIGRLVQECAYEHWHRMLFARFLAETDFLIEPKSGVAVTLDEM